MKRDFYTVTSQVRNLMDKQYANDVRLLKHVDRFGRNANIVYENLHRVDKVRHASPKALPNFVHLRIKNTNRTKILTGQNTNRTKKY